MPRSDYSSDPDDGSITSDEEEFNIRKDDERVGPTSPIQQQSRAPWQSGSNPGASNSAPPKRKTTRFDPKDTRKSSSPVPGRQETLAHVLESQRTMPITGPNARFRSAVTKVIRMQKMRNYAGDSEPGVDPRREGAAALYAKIHEKCSIQIIDYGPTRSEFKMDMTNEQLEQYLLNDPQERPLWSKVRWIHVGGISWDVIRALSLKYDIHPLSIEDILHGRKTSRSKSDYYSKHLFVRVLCHTVEDDGTSAHNSTTPKPEPSASSTTVVDGLPPNSAKRTPTMLSTSRRTSSPVRESSEEPKQSQETASEPQDRQQGMFRRKKKTESPYGIKGLASASLGAAQPWVAGGDVENGAWAKEVYPELNYHGPAGFGPSGAPIGRKNTRLSSRFLSTPQGQKAIANQKTVNELKKEERVLVRIRNLYLILFRDGTFLSFHQDTDPSFFKPIMDRLHTRDTLLRSTGDASLLLQAVLDVVVDNAVRVVDVYHAQLLKFERDILIKPKMKTVRYLHIASGDLTTHKRSLSPLKSLIYGLRRYDLDRAVAQANPLSDEKPTGFMSHKAKVYLADVMDHTEYILASLEMFENISENLIAYTFNIVAYETNATMRGLTIATVIFFPLTFLTGYFGMNFEIMHSVQDNSEVFFWEICIPLMVVVVTAFVWSDAARFIHYIQKQMIKRRFMKE